MDDPLTNAEAKQPLNRRQRLGGVLEVIVLVASLALAVFNATRHDWVQLTLSLMVGFGAACMLFVLAQQRRS